MFRIHMRCLILILSSVAFNFSQQINRCFTSGENFLGLGTSIQLDSASYYRPGRGLKILYEYFQDSINHTYKIIDTVLGNDSIIQSVSGILNSQILEVPYYLNDSVFTTYYFGGNYRVDSTIFKNRISQVEYEKVVNRYSPSERVQYFYNRGSLYIIDSVVYNDSGLTRFSVELPNDIYVDTCISQGDSCVCVGNIYGGRSYYRIQNDQYVYRKIDFENQRDIFLWSPRIVNRLILPRKHKGVFIDNVIYQINGRIVSSKYDGHQYFIRRIKKKLTAQ